MRYLTSALFVVAMGITAGGFSSAPRAEQSELSTITAEQCTFFAVNGQNDICHWTGAARKPFISLRTSEEACVNGHVEHDGDYLTSSDPWSPLYDPTCNGLGCLPEGAPYNGSIECCEGLAPTDGICAPIDPLR